MTKPNILKKFFKKFFNMDVDGNSVVSVFDFINRNYEELPAGDTTHNSYYDDDYVWLNNYSLVPETETTKMYTIKYPALYEISPDLPLIVKNSNFEVGTTYTVVFDGMTYTLECYKDGKYTCIGNSELSQYGVVNKDTAHADSSVPFIVNTYGTDTIVVFANTTGTHTISITGKAKLYNKLDDVYLNGVLIGRGENVYAEEFNYNTTASGESSHAEGNGTTASGKASHAEGETSKATAHCSHAEGAKTTASAIAAHAEGYSSTASAQASHSEGYGTIASSNNQHVQGTFNVEDSNDTYAFIIGNGTKESARSNAFAIKWDGTIVFANGTAITPAQFSSLLGLLNS